MLAQGEQFAIDALLASAGVDVTYQRGATSAAVRAVVGSSQWGEAGDPTSVQVASVDFIVRVADLAGLPGPPRQGDRITHAGATYKVAPFAGEGEYRFTSGFAYAYRIHSTRIT